MSPAVFFWGILIGIIFIIIGVVLLRWINKKVVWYEIALIVLGIWFILISIALAIIFEIGHLGAKAGKTGLNGAEDLAPLAGAALLL